MGKCLSKKNNSAKSEDNGNDGPVSPPIDKNDVEIGIDKRYTQQPVSPIIPQLPVPPTPKTAHYLALYDYDKRTEEDLSFKKGEILEVNTEDLEADWWRAKSKESGNEGFIPRNYVAPLEALEAEA